MQFSSGWNKIEQQSYGCGQQRVCWATNQTGKKCLYIILWSILNTRQKKLLIGCQVRSTV